MEICNIQSVITESMTDIKHINKISDSPLKPHSCAEKLSLDWHKGLMLAES